MQFGQLISKSFELSWRFKSLWIFGFFAGFGMNTNFNFDSDPTQNMDFGDFNFAPEALWALMGAAIILSLIFVITHLIASPALVDAVNKLTRGGEYRFSESFSRGIDFFLRFLGLLLITVCLWILFGGGAIIVGVILFAVDTAVGVLGIIGMILFSLLIGFVLYNVFSIAERAIVVRDGRINDCLAEGWSLLKSNVGHFVVFFLINVVLMIGIGLFVLMVFGVITVAMLGFFTSGEISFASKILTGVIIGLPLSLVFGGWSGTFFHSLYTLFYFELVQPGSMTTPPAPQVAGNNQSPTGG